MSFLDNVGEGWIEEAGGEPEAEATEELNDGQPQAEPEPVAEEPEPEPAPEPQDADDKEPHKVPYAELRREREKRQEAERKLAETARVQPEPVKAAPIPDAYEQPEQFSEHLESRFDQERFALRAEMSGFKAEQTYGKETVEAAVAWATERNDPALGIKVRQSADPVGVVVQEYQQSRTLETLAGKSLDDYARSYAIEKGWIVSQGAEPPVTPKPSSPTPPRSLASKPGSGGVSQTAGGDAFGEVFSSTGMGLSKG